MTDSISFTVSLYELDICISIRARFPKTRNGVTD